MNTSFMLDKKLKETVIELINQHSSLQDVIQAIIKYKGIPLLVGGAVRDLFLNIIPKDLDIEVYNISVEQLEEILSKFGTVIHAGKSFGVLRINTLDIDWSLPRSDSSGRKPSVVTDPNLDYTTSFGRRDLTINAMGINLATYELIDPFNGAQDIKSKTLRSPRPEFFTEDPLRFYRVMQFIARFEMTPDSTLNQICKTMNLKGVARERIGQECDKMMLKSHRPSLGWRWINSIGRLKELFPELAATCTTPQEYEWHPEGFVFEHLMQTCDSAAAQKYTDIEYKKMMIYAALCHDLGKATTTKLIKGRLRSWGHDKAGVPIARSFLTKLAQPEQLIKKIGLLIEHHMAPLIFVKGGAKAGAYKRLALQLGNNLCIADLAFLSRCDARGRNGESHLPLTTPVERVDIFEANAQEFGVLYAPEKPLVTAQDLLGHISPGKALGTALDHAYQTQIDKNITDKEYLIELVTKKY